MTTNKVPVVGMGCTQGVGNDCYPYTIVEVKSDRCIVVQRDSYTPTANHDFYNHQEYNYTPNPDANKITVTLRKNGRWYEKGQTMGYCAYSLGHRRYYQDPSS